MEEVRKISARNLGGKAEESEIVGIKGRFEKKLKYEVISSSHHQKRVPWT